MNITELTEQVNRITDESFPVEFIVSFLNDGIAAVNVECESDFPFLDSSDLDAEPDFPESWQRMLLVNYAAARVKQNDSSQFEYSDLYAQFEHALSKFKSSYEIPEAYRLRSQGPRMPDWNNSIHRW